MDRWVCEHQQCYKFIPMYQIDSNFLQLLDGDDKFMMINCFNCQEELQWQCMSEVCPEEVGRLWSQQFSTFQQYLILEIPPIVCQGMLIQVNDEMPQTLFYEDSAD